jgi:hypothetical protein
VLSFSGLNGGDWLGRALGSFQHHPSEVCHNVGHQHELLGRRRHQNQISEDLRYFGGDFRQISLFALQVASNIS